MLLSARRTTGITGACLLALALGLAPLARAGDKSVGGHIGFGFPIVTKNGSNVTTPADYFQMALPVAITVSGHGRMYSTWSLCLR